MIRPPARKPANGDKIHYLTPRAKGIWYNYGATMKGDIRENLALKCRCARCVSTDTRLCYAVALNPSRRHKNPPLRQGRCRVAAEGYDDYHRPAPPSEGIDRAVFLSQGRVKAETFDSRQFLDPDELSKNYFE